MGAEVKSIPLVAAPSSMTDANFRLHMIHRHDTEIGPDNFTWDVSQPYRAMHRRMHHADVTAIWEHEHSPEPPGAAVEFALRCLMSNRLFGWREIAGTKGVVSAFPDGSYGIRLGSRDNRTETRYFNQVDHVARILMRGRFVK